MKPYVPYVSSGQGNTNQQSASASSASSSSYGRPQQQQSSYSSTGGTNAYASSSNAGGSSSIPFSQALNHPPPSAPPAATALSASAPPSQYAAQQSSSTAYGQQQQQRFPGLGSTGGGGTFGKLAGMAASAMAAVPTATFVGNSNNNNNNNNNAGGGYNYNNNNNNYNNGHVYASSAPPAAMTTGYPAGGGPNKYPDQSSVVVHGTPLAHSSTYNGLPTNSVVSEGNPVKCHKVDYEIKGTSMQLVEIVLDPNETVIAEAGEMMYLEDGIDFEAKFGDGSNPSQSFWGKLMSAGGRILTGESLFLTHFTNTGSQVPRRVAFAAPYPGTILPINLQDHNETLICQKDAFLCAAHGTKVSMAFNKKIGAGLFGGEGFILQKLQGDGMAFIHAGGTVIRRDLNNERIRLDTGCLVAFTSGISYDIQRVPGLKTMFFGGEGIFLATLQGTGTVWMQSLPFSRMCDRIIKAAPSLGGNNVGEGTPLNPYGGVLGGNGLNPGSLGFQGF